MTIDQFKQLIAVLSSLVTLLQGAVAHPGVLTLQQKQQLHNGLLGAITTTSGFNFPTSSYSFSDGDIVNAGDFNNIINWIGTRNSTDTTSLSYAAFNPNVASSTGVLPRANGGTGTSTTPSDGQFLGASSTIPTWKTLLGGSGIAVTQTPTSTVVTASGSGGSSISITAGMGVNTGNAVYVASSSVSNLEYQNVTSTIGANSVNACLFPRSTITGDQAIACAQRFSTTTTMTATALMASFKTGGGSPAGNIILELVPDNSGVPSTTILASTTITNANITSSCKVLAGVLNNPVSITGGSIFWVLATSTTAASDTNYWAECGVGTSSKVPVSARLLQSGTWNTEGDIGDYQVSVDQTTSTTAGLIYPASAYATFTYATSTNSTFSYSESGAFIGFANATTSAGVAATINIAGATTVSGLSAGLLYYLDSTLPALGTITASAPAAPAATRKVCISSTASQCVITNVP